MGPRMVGSGEGEHSKSSRNSACFAYPSGAGWPKNGVAEWHRPRGRVNRVDDKPKTALDWIYWAREQKGDAAPPAAEPPAKPVASPTEVDATSAPSQRVEVAPAASAEPVVSEQAPVQAPPALPTDETVEETAGCGAIDKDLEDFEDSENLPDLDDFDRLMADAAVFESSDDPAPTPQAVAPPRTLQFRFRRHRMRRGVKAPSGRLQHSGAPRPSSRLRLTP